MNIKRCGLFILLIISLLACAGEGADSPQSIESLELENITVATLTPAPTATSPAPVVVVEGGGEQETATEPAAVPEPTITPFVEQAPETVIFEIPPELATAVTRIDFEEAVSLSSDAPFWANYPDYSRYLLEGYAVTNNLFEAQINVYPVPAYTSVNIAAAEQIEALQQILATEPDLNSLGDSALPFLPPINGTQVFQAQAEYVAFDNGRGIRYLTQYAQAVTTVNNAELFYTFQGLSDDGRSYISAIFPVRLDSLPDAAPETAEEYEAIADNYSDYLSEALSGLESSLTTAFSPSLDLLDQIITASFVNIPEPEVEITDAGRVPLTLFYPRPNGQARTGRPLWVEGYTNPGGATTLLVTLDSGVNRLASETFFSEANGHWSGELPIPYSVEGEVTLTVSKVNEELSTKINLVRDRHAEIPPGAVVDLYRPSAGTAVVSGYTIFLEGRTTNPIDDTVSIGLLMDDCSTFVARYSFPLASPGGSWNGQLILPQNIRGEGCLIAYTGEYGVDEWREVHLPVMITDEGDSDAPRLDVASLFQDVYALGDTVYVYGAAVATSQVNVRLLLEGEEELLSTSVPVGGFGFWEVNLELPTEDVAGFVVLEVTIPDDEDAFYSLGFEVR